MTMEQGPPSIRGLVDQGDAGPGTPLRDFSGELHDIIRTEDRGNTFVNLNFTELDVLLSMEPYLFPTASIRIKESTKKGSRYGVFAATLIELIPEDEDLADQVGKTIRLAWVEGRDESGNPNKYHEIKGFLDKNWVPEVDEAGVELPNQVQPNVSMAAWEVMEIDGRVRGEEAVSARDKAMSLLDGSTLPNFNKAAMSDPTIKTDAEVKASITSGGFVKEMVEEGLFTKGTNGVYSKVE